VNSSQKNFFIGQGELLGPKKLEEMKIYEVYKKVFEKATPSKKGVKDPGEKSCKEGWREKWKKNREFLIEKKGSRRNKIEGGLEIVGGFYT